MKYNTHEERVGRRSFRTIKQLLLLTFLAIGICNAHSAGYSLVWQDDFGVVPDSQRMDFPDPNKSMPGHTYESDTAVSVNDGSYAISNSTAWCLSRVKGETFFRLSRDHTGNTDGGMLIVNTKGQLDKSVIYEQKIDFPLCKENTYKLVVYAASITSFGCINASLIIRLKDEDGNAIPIKTTAGEITELETGDIPFWEGWDNDDPKAKRDWSEYALEFESGNHKSVTIQIVNNAFCTTDGKRFSELTQAELDQKQGGCDAGNDFAIDDIMLFRYDDDKEAPEVVVSAHTVSSEKSSDCIYMSSYSIPDATLSAWKEIYKTIYLLWQESEDGFKWNEIAGASGEDATTMKAEVKANKTMRYRVIVTGGKDLAQAKEVAEEIALNGGPKDGCWKYAISNTLAASKPAPDCTFSLDLKSIFNEDFGTMPTGIEIAEYKGNNDFTFPSTKKLDGGNAVLTNNTENLEYNVWGPQPSGDPSNSGNGAMLNVITNEKKAIIYQESISGPFCNCKAYIFSFMLKRNHLYTSTDITAQVLDKTSNVIASYPISDYSFEEWDRVSVPFELDKDYTGNITIQILYTGEKKVSYLIDDITVRVCGDIVPQDSIYIDKDVDLKSLTNFDCTEEPGHTIDMSSMDGWKDYPNAAIVWQSSTDGGETWETLAATGKSIKFATEDGGDIAYRAIIGEDAATAKAVANGTASDGCGVYLITNSVYLSCTAQCHFNDEMLVLWKDDFGSVPAGTRKQCAYLKGHTFEKKMSESVNDGEYAVVSRMKDAGTWFAAMDGTDHTGNADGGFLVLNVDPDYKGKIIYEQTLGFTTCDETSYFFSLWASSISKRVANGETDGVLCNLTLEISDAATGDVLASIETGDIPNASSLSGNIPWKNYGISFVSKGEKVKLRIYDHAGNGKKGNDLALDDISLIACEQSAPKIELAVDGEDDVTGICNETTYTLNMGDIDGWKDIYGNDVYCLWQKSADGGETWETLNTKSGVATTYGQLEVTALRNMQEVNDSLVNVGYRYRVIVAGPKDEVTEQIAQQGYPNNGCYLYRISNVMTVRCECNAPEFEAASDKKFDICEDGEDITLKVTETNTVALDSVCWYTKQPKDEEWTLLKKYEGERITDASFERTITPSDSIRYLFLGYNETCASDSVIFEVNVEKPIVLKDLVSTILCVGSDTTYKAELAEGCLGKPLNYEWNGTSSTKETFEIENIAQDVTVKLVAKGAICTSEPVTATVEAEKETKIEGTLTDTEVCALEETEFDSKAVAANIQWYQTYSGKNIFTAIEGGTEAKLICSPDSSRTYKVVASGVKCPSKELNVNVEVHYPAKIDASIDKEAYCLGGTSTITATLDHVTSLRWMAKAEGETNFSVVKSGTYLETETTTSEQFSPTVTTEYIVQTPSEGCAAAQSDVMKVVVEQPVNFTLSADKALICKGDVVTLQFEMLDGVLETAEGNAKDVVTTETLAVTPTENTTYELKVTGKLCTTDLTKTVDIDVEIPTTFGVLTTPKAVVCEQTAVELNCDVTPSNAPYRIMKSDDGSRFTEIAEAGVATETCYYKLQSKAGEACQASESNTVKVEVEDSVRYTFTANKEAICLGNEIELTYKKKSGEIVSSEINGDQNITINGNNTYYATPTTAPKSIYEAVVSGKECPEVRKSIEIEVQKPATLQISANKESICVNDKVNITLTAQDAQSTQWFRSTNGSDYSEIMTDGTNLMPQQKTWYKVGAIGSEACGNGMSNAVVVDVEDSIRFTLKQPNELICNGTTIASEIKLESGQPKDISWDKNGANLANTLTIRDMPTDEHNKYVATVTGNICPAVTKQFEVNVEQPASISQFNASATQICINTAVELTIDQQNALGLVWEKQVGSGNYETFSEALTASQTDQPTAKTNYRVRTTGSKVCHDATSPVVSVNVEDSVKVTLPADTFVCNGINMVLNAKVTGTPKTLTWTKKTEEGEETMSTTAKSFTVKPTTTTTYKVVAQASQCPNAEDEMTVNVEDIPELSISASADSLCEGEEVTLTATFVNDTSIVWMSRFAKGIVFSDITKGAPSISETPGASMEYMATGVTEHGCKVKSDVIAVAVSANITAIADNISFCEGDSSELKVTGEGAYKYEWYADQAHSELLGNSTTLKVKPTETTTYYLVVTNGSCKEELMPEAEVASKPKIIGLEDRAAREIEVNATSTNGALEYHYGLDTDWTSDNVFTNFYFGKPYTIKVRDALGCMTDTTFTTSTYDIRVPSVVSPNGDGVNDAFEVVNFGKYPNSVIRIYDRFGKLLIKQTSEDYNAWDGTYNGNKMPSTDYWYDIWIEELAQYFTGHFTLIWGD